MIHRLRIAGLALIGIAVGLELFQASPEIKTGYTLVAFALMFGFSCIPLGLIGIVNFQYFEVPVGTELILYEVVCFLLIAYGLAWTYVAAKVLHRLNL